MKSDPANALPWPLTIASLLAFAALYLVGKQFIALPALGVLLLATHFIPSRLPANALVQWLTRTCLFIFVLLIAPDRHTSGISLLLEPDYIHTAGYLLATELVIRAWLKRPLPPSSTLHLPSSFSPSRLGEILLLSTLILTTATNTYDPKYIRAIAPAYAFFAALSLRYFRPRPSKRPPIASFSAAITAVLLLGLFATLFVARYENEISRLFISKFLTAKRDTSSIGLSKTPTLGPVNNPYPSDVRVCTVEGPLPDPHLRVLAFDTYDDGSWSPSPDARAFSPLPSFGPQSDIRNPQSVTITRLASDANILCLPLETLAIHAPEDPPLERDSLSTVRTTSADIPALYEYSIQTSRTPSKDSTLFPGPSKDDLTRLLSLPKDLDPRVKSLASSLATGNSHLSTIQSITHHLQSTHAYSLSYNPGEGDPLTSFLLGNKPAHCQYFAAATVLLARLNHIPARFVTGYYAHEITGDHTLTVRQRDAHAWVEVYLPEAGWMTLDTTPSAGTPRELFPNSPPWYRRAWERVTDTFNAIETWLGNRTLTQGAIMVAALAAVPMLIRLYHSVRVPKPKPAPPTPYDLPPTLAPLAARFEALMKRHDLPPPSHSTWQEHLTNTPHFAPFLKLYNAARFGPPPTPSDLSTLSSLLGTLEEGTGMNGDQRDP